MNNPKLFMDIVDGLFFPSFLAIMNKLLWIFIYKSLYVQKLSLHLVKYSGSGMTGSYSMYGFNI